VIWIAEERGFIPVRVERFLPNARAPLTVYETTRTQRIDGVWVPIQVREETRYEGTETIQLAATEVQVNAVPDSVFNVAWVKQGYVWDNASKTMLQIQPSGQLGLGDWMASPVTPAVLTRMAVACLIFVALWLLVIGIQRSLRRMANRDGS